MSERHVMAGRAGGDATYQLLGREHFSRISNGRRPRLRFSKKEKGGSPTKPMPFPNTHREVAMTNE